MPPENSAYTDLLKRTRLRAPIFNRVALVDRGANNDLDSGEGAHIVLFKAETSSLLEDLADGFEKAAMIKCPDCGKLVTPTADSNCPECGADLSKVAKVGRKVSGARLAALRTAHETIGAIIDEAAPPAPGKEGDVPPERVKKDDLPKDLDAVTKAYIEQIEADGSALSSRVEALEKAAKPENDDATPFEKSLESVTDPALKAFLKSEHDARVVAEENAKTAREAVEKAEDDRLDREAIAKAETDFHGLPGMKASEIGPAIRRLAKVDADAATKIERMLKGGAEAVAQSAIFRQIGSDLPADENSAVGRLENVAKALFDARRATDPAFTFEKAMTEVTRDPKNADLVAEYREEQREASRR